MQDKADREFIIAALDLLMRGAGRDPQDTGDTPYISVIVPVFNRERLLQGALESLRRQTWRNFEAVVVDDASTDGTPEILARWAANEPWIRPITNDARSGAATARNRGLAAARGEVIAYLDSDNLFYPHALAAIAQTFKSSADIWSIYTSHLWSGADGTLEVRCPRISLAGLMAGEGDGVDLNVFAHRGALYRALGGFDERLTRLIDWELLIRYAKTVMPRRVPTPTGHYRHGDWPRISNDVSFAWNRYLINERHANTVNLAIRVLRIAARDADIAATAADDRFLLSSGVKLEIWWASEADASCGDPPADTGVKAHRNSLAEAIAEFRPDILHLDEAGLFDRHAPQLVAAGLPVTVRDTGMDAAPGLLARLRQCDVVRSVYVVTPPPAAEQHGTTIVPVSFDPARYHPVWTKDRRLVVQAGVALPAEDIAWFIDVAARCRRHRFVLCLSGTTVADRDAAVSENAKRGAPVEIHTDRPPGDVADWVRRAGISLQSGNPATPTLRMAAAIVEALATGAYLLARQSVWARPYVGAADRLCDSVDQAARLIQATLGWDDRRWRDEGHRSIDQAFLNHAPGQSTRIILDDWMSIMKAEYLRPREAGVLTVIAPRDALFFGTGGIGVQLLRTGFHRPERWGVWTGQSTATLAFAAGEADWSAVRALEIEAQAYVGPDAMLPVRISLNGRGLGTLDIGRKTGRHRLALADVTIEPGQVVSLVIETPQPRSPGDFGAAERRYLGLGLERMSFV